jgi:hypothetical protein
MASTRGAEATGTRSMPMRKILTFLVTTVDGYYAVPVTGADAG